jgi:hypothetical protein
VLAALCLLCNLLCLLAPVSVLCKAGCSRFNPGVGLPLPACLPQEDDGAGEEMVVSGLEDGFHRLIAHGLAEFHGMPSHSRVLEDGSKEVVVRRRTQATAAGAIVAQVSRSAAHALGGGAWTDEDVSPMTPAAQPGRWPVAIACSDILQLLADGPHQPMSAAVLRHAYLQPDSSSDAGDHCYPHQPPQDQEQI